jgi:hypothetical protein
MVKTVVGAHSRAGHRAEAENDERWIYEVRWLLRSLYSSLLWMWISEGKILGSRMARQGFFEKLTQRTIDRVSRLFRSQCETCCTQPCALSQATKLYLKGFVARLDLISSTHAEMAAVVPGSLQPLASASNMRYHTYHFATHRR